MSGIRTSNSAIAGLALVGLVIAVVSVALGQVPREINYQGRLLDASAVPLVGGHSVVFRIFDDPAGGVALWTETQAVTADSAGVFAVVLGSVDPIGVAFDGPRWLEVEVDGEVLAPRRDMASVPFALQAANSHMLQGLDADAFADSAHNHDDRYFTRAELSTAGTINAPTNPVDWANLKGVPGGFADGTDNVGTGDGYSLDASDGNPTDALYVDDEGSVGISTTTPQARLHVVSPTGYVGYFVGPQNYFSGKVGIGRLNPQYKLHVEEGSSADNACATYSAATSVIARNSRGIVGETFCADTVYVGSGVMGSAKGAASRSCGVLGIADGIRGSGVVGLAVHTTGKNIGINGATFSSNGFGCYIYGPRNYFSGKVGIGTEDPQALLHLNGGVSDLTALQLSNNGIGVTGADGLHLAVAADGRGSLLSMENKALDLGTNGVTRLSIQPSGKISIGGQDTLAAVTISAVSPHLALNATNEHGVTTSGIEFYDHGSSVGGIGWDDEYHLMDIGGSQRVFINLASGWLGVGRHEPANLLHVEGAGSTAGGVNGYTEVVGHFTTTGSGHTAVSIDAAVNLDPILYLAEGGKAYWDLRTDSDDGQKFELRYHGPGAKNNILVVADTLGNVGIGTTGPTAKLDVSGSTGYGQVRMRTAFTPTGTADTHGNVGDVAWDSNYLYVKTAAGWKRAALSTW